MFISKKYKKEIDKLWWKSCTENKNTCIIQIKVHIWIGDEIFPKYTDYINSSLNNNCIMKRVA